MADGSFAGNARFDATAEPLSREFWRKQAVKGLRTTWNEAYLAMEDWVRKGTQPNKAYLDLFIEQNLVNEAEQAHPMRHECILRKKMWLQ